MSKKRKNLQSKKINTEHKPSSQKDVAIYAEKYGWLLKGWQYIKGPWGTFIALVAFVASVLGIYSYVQYEKDKKIASLTGVISSPALAVIKYLSVGSTRFRIDSPDGVFLKDGDQPILIMNLKDGKLLVSTTIRDQKGNIIAELLNNEWCINKNNIFDRNYTNNALEIRDQTGRVTLQVVHFGDTIHLAGIFRCRNGMTNVFCPLAEGGTVIGRTPPGIEPKYPIKPIFEYPSEQHFGSCPGLKSLEKIIIHGPGAAYRMDGALDICKGKKR